MDTFVDSSWYYFRYCSPNDDTQAFDVEKVRQWLPVDQYVGGVEHAILHLLYSRFVTKVLYDMDMIDFVEPFTRLLNQGQVINQGKAMSKSLGNGVDLGEQIDAYGVDAIRTTLVFAGPPEDDIDWADVSPGSTAKFLQRAYRLAQDVASPAGTDAAGGDLELRRTTHRTIADITESLESGRFNVAVARIMELTNATRKTIDSGAGGADPAVREAAEFVTQALSVVAPYVAEEMWGARARPPWRVPPGPPRPGTACPGVGDPGRPGAGQGARQAGGARRHHRGGRDRGRAADPGCSGHWPVGTLPGHRAAAQDGEHRPRQVGSFPQACRPPDRFAAEPPIVWA